MIDPSFACFRRAQGSGYPASVQSGLVALVVVPHVGFALLLAVQVRLLPYSKLLLPS